jgi:hypothetical protein
MKRQLFLCGLLVVNCLSGCNKSLPSNKATVKVEGKVLFASGKPAQCVFVVFEPKDKAGGVEASGWTDQDGKFSLRSYSTKEPDGAVKGEYLVRLEPYDPGVGIPVPKGAKPSVFADRYKKTDSSDLSAQIKEETHSLEFTLKE